MQPIRLLVYDRGQAHDDDHDPDREERAALRTDYGPPPLFADDLSDVPGTRSKPHFFLGGARTGSLIHVDPRCACGWNACLFGAKRW